MRILAAALGSIVGLASLLAACGHQPPAAPVTSKPQQAVVNATNHVVAAPVTPDPRVGAVFLGGSDLHACTGSVLQAAAGDLVLTAAHCLGGGGQATFVPGFPRQAAPGEVWTLDAVYLDSRWVADRGPRADYAIARASRSDDVSVEAVAGSALSLGSAPARGSRVNVVAYPDYVGGTPIGCQASTTISDDGYPELPCAGLADGTSGAPWISGSTVTGVIGGLHGGGCTDNLSFSSPFDQHITELLARAEAAGPGDVPPAGLADQC
ncbi:MAG: trypsin-like peptidase domain-containing protein [Mycobacterium sp.]|nr:trypsin-like peptidase domain-containing protein [Mycobacterium sp.]